MRVIFKKKLKGLITNNETQKFMTCAFKKCADAFFCLIPKCMLELYVWLDYLRVLVIENIKFLCIFLLKKQISTKNLFF